jgi:site-specific DNA recombinase
LLTPSVDLKPLVAESQELRQRRDDLAALLAEGVLTVGAVREQQTKLQKRMDDVQAQINAAEGGSQVTALIMASSVADHWHQKLTLSQKRAIIAAGASVTIRKQQSTRKFDPDAIKIKWRGQ